MQASATTTHTSPATTTKHWVDRFHAPLAAWLILLISLVLTLIAWYVSNDTAQKRAADRFEFEVAEAKSSIKKRMLEYEQMLHSGIGFHKANTSVTREQWRIFVESLHLSTYYPGVQGVGFAQWIKKEDLPQHTANIRAEGFADYSVRPEGERDVYTSIVFLEPFDWRNQRAFGYDMFSQETRREAMTRAIKTGLPAVSGKVTLVQETETDVQFGFLMYLPLYNRDVSTADERWREIRGFVYSPFRMGDLMNGILGEQAPEIDFEIFDGETVGQDRPLYNSTGRSAVSDADRQPRFSVQEALVFGGRTWTVHFRSNEAFEASTASAQPLMVAMAGAVIDILLFYVILSLSRMRQRAVRLADEMVAQLGAKELQFKAIADTAHEAITTVDESGRIRYANAAALDTFGYDESRMNGIELTKLLKIQSMDELVGLAARRAGQPAHEWMDDAVEIAGWRADGSEFPLELSLARWQARGESFVTIMSRDITERKKVDRLKREFISTVSHELRTPLTSVLGSLRLVGTGMVGRLDGKGSELISIATKNVERLGRLINDILDIEKIESDTITLDVREHDLRALLEQAIEANKGYSNQYSVGLTMNCQTNAVIRVDCDRFLQVMNNLLSNAIKFSPRGETVYVGTLVVENAKVRVSVSDRGRGVPDEFRSRIFQKFAQADASDTREKGGTGLGLSIVKSLVERFGGEAGYESEWERGSTFYIDLPVVHVKTLSVPAAEPVS